LSEAAIIAGLVKAPSNYSPTADAEAARGRAGVVIQSMREYEFITASEAAAAEPAQVDLVPAPKQNSVRYFTDWVLPQLDTLIDESVEPIDVFTTLDPGMQRTADQAINANTPRALQGALVSLDRDGAIRAMVGGKDYVASLYNRATQATRQPGSAFKLFVYLSALEAGHTPKTSWWTRRSRSTAGARATTIACSAGRSRSARLSLSRSTPSRPSSARKSASAPSPTWPSASASPPRSTPSPRWCSARPTSGCST
jgi:membrane peptidoglycan carboxypeptidase